MTPDPIRSGETLGKDLGALGMSTAELAWRIEVPVKRMIAIINGRCAVTRDTVLGLGRFFGASREFWLSLQELYEICRAEQKNGATVACLSTPDTGDRLPAADLRIGPP